MRSGASVWVLSIRSQKTEPLKSEVRPFGSTAAARGGTVGCAMWSWPGGKSSGHRSRCGVPGGAGIRLHHRTGDNGRCRSSHPSRSTPCLAGWEIQRTSLTLWRSWRRRNQASNEMLDFAKDCGPNYGVLLDSWHWYHAGATIEDIHKAGKARIVTVHVSDAAKMPPEDVRDNARLMPGEGVVDLVGFFKALKEVGYEDGVSPEPLGRIPKEMPAEEGARLACARLELTCEWGHTGRPPGS